MRVAIILIVLLSMFFVGCQKAVQKKKADDDSAPGSEPLLSASSCVQAPATLPDVSTAPTDPHSGRAWSIFDVYSGAINANTAWAVQTDCSATPIAIIDTGVDFNHPDLVDNIWTNTREIASNGRDDDGNGYADDVHGWNFISENNLPLDNHFHGTHVAGTIAAVANNGAGIAGICWKAKIIPVKFLDENGSGTYSDAVEAIDYSIKVGAKIINASWSGTETSRMLRDAIERANSAGVLVVAAAGNNSANFNNSPRYPAAFGVANVIAVGAASASAGLASFSNYSSERVHIAAPGTSIYSTLPSEGYGWSSGTSMATPHVSAAAALYWNYAQGLNAHQVRDCILDRSAKLGNLSSSVQDGRKLDVKTLFFGTK